uniref:Uncharacterized protein n=1 Tax=Ditylenchus dipsaci TaxID=166011 RepID=A0A915DGU1_9BILA
MDDFTVKVLSSGIDPTTLKVAQKNVLEVLSHHPYLTNFSVLLPWEINPKWIPAKLLPRDRVTGLLKLHVSQKIEDICPPFPAAKHISQLIIQPFYVSHKGIAPSENQLDAEYCHYGPNSGAKVPPFHKFNSTLLKQSKCYILVPSRVEKGNLTVAENIKDENGSYVRHRINLEPFKDIWYEDRKPSKYHFAAPFSTARNDMCFEDIGTALLCDMEDFGTNIHVGFLHSFMLAIKPDQYTYLNVPTSRLWPVKYLGDCPKDVIQLAFHVFAIVPPLEDCKYKNDLMWSPLWAAINDNGREEFLEAYKQCGFAQPPVVKLMEAVVWN